MRTPLDATGALRRAPSSPDAGRAGDYRSVWDAAADGFESACAMVDGSANEAELQEAGQRVANGLRRALAITREHRVLEVGCGVARIGRELAPHCAEWHGSDVSPNMLRIAAGRTAHLANVRLQPLAGATLAPYADCTFDRVYSHIVLFHMDKEDMFGYLCEMRRVVKPGGLMYFDSWNLTHPFGWQRFLHERELYPDAPRPLYRNQFSTKDEIGMFMAAAGCGVVGVLDRSSLLQAIAVRPRDDEPPRAAADRVRAQLGKHLAAIEPGSAQLTTLPRPEDAIVTVDVPVSGATLNGRVQVGGWAMHPQRLDDPAWGEVAVFCVTVLLQRDDGLPQELGRAAHNLPRPDVAEALKTTPFVGFSFVFDTTVFPDGDYTLWIETHLTCGYTHRALPIRIANHANSRRV